MIFFTKFHGDRTKMMCFFINGQLLRVFFLRLNVKISRLLANCGKNLKYSILEFIKGYSSHHRSTVHALVLLVWLLSTKPQEAFWQLFSIELLSTALKVMTTASLLMPIEMLRESKRQKCSFFLLFSLSEYRITHINAIFLSFSTYIWNYQS